MARQIKFRFLSDGFQRVLTSSGVEAMVQSVARSQAQVNEQEYGVPYEVKRMANATSRVVYTVSPSEETEMRLPNLTHEKWIEEVWPRVGKAKWRPKS